MGKDNYFDNILKCTFDDSSNNLKTSRDIFNEAWMNKHKITNKRKYLDVKYVKKTALITACFTAFIFAGAFTYSPYVRAVAKEVLKNIFVIEKLGKDFVIVEKSEEEKLNYNIGGVKVTSKNKDEIEKRLGFKVDFPSKIDNYYEDTSGTVGMTVYDIKYKDFEKLEDKFFKAIDDDKAFEELKEYKMERYVTSKYVNAEGENFLLTLSKEKQKLIEDKIKEGNVIKEIDVSGVKCSIWNVVYPSYEFKDGGKYFGEDLTKKPISIDNRYYMNWNYEGIRYSIYIGEELDIEVVTKFVENYIRTLKQ